MPTQQEIREDLVKRRQRVEKLWDHLHIRLGEEIERRRKKELCLRRATGYNQTNLLCEGVVAERDEELDLELCYLLLRLLEADILYMEEIRNEEYYRLEVDALNLKSCLGCLIIHREGKGCHSLVKECLYRIAALVEDAGDDQNKMAFAIQYLSDLDRNRDEEGRNLGYWGCCDSTIYPRQGQQNEFRDVIQKISKDFFPDRYDMMIHIRSMASSFRPTVKREPFNNLLYFRTPAKWFRINRNISDCRRHIKL